MSKPLKTSFKPEWLTLKEYKIWLTTVPGKPHRGKCKICQKEFDTGNMGRSSLDSHAVSAKHKERLKERESLSALYFVEQPVVNQVAICSSNTSVINNGQQDLDSLILPLAVSHDEIRWVFKVVLSNASLRSCLDLSELFKSMFSDSAIASAFQQVKRSFHTTSVVEWHHLLKTFYQMTLNFLLFFQLCLMKV